MTTVSANSRTVTAARQRTGLRAISLRYWVCLGLLGLGAVFLGVLPEHLKIYFQKHAVELKEELAYFDPDWLGPRYRRHPASDHIPKLTAEMIETLGTDRYYQVYLTDRQKSPSDPTHTVFLFLTYYTGKPDMVPHVPDECYVAGGYDKTSAETKYVAAAGVGAPADDVPVRIVRFVAPQAQRLATDGGDEVAVSYFFHVNGQYATTRNEVRVRLSNPFERYAYYMKVEVNFKDGSLKRSATAEETAAALGPFLEVLMPALFEHHLDLAPFGVSGAGPEASE